RPMRASTTSRSASVAPGARLAYASGTSRASQDPYVENNSTERIVPPRYLPGTKGSCHDGGLSRTEPMAALLHGTSEIPMRLGLRSRRRCLRGASGQFSPDQERKTY